MPPEWEFDLLDTSQRNYFLLLDDQIPVATLRYQLKNETCFQPDRFCVAKAYRKQGIGRSLLFKAEQVAKNNGCRLSYLVAELTAQSFYEGCGYRSCTSPFEEDGILCIGMEKIL
ncbi:GNAT family N-acetyltransferase [Enterococcus sp. MSG2901]|uniref:GNAT family N-acetyltransferase n=1 Tax=Candidatus Enterococcus courvalinii TaxID=2815329 RepID=A0ABS3I0Y8_9ENTE|nr:GNAT family N-acetyltransferase [Enterococcus sp. MSG2901]